MEGDSKFNLIKANLEGVLGYISSVQKETGKEIYLVGATKTQSVGAINFAIDCGLKIVGENRAQEFRDKLAFLDGRAEKHFIGHLQKNKIKYVVGKASLIHSCDSLSLAKEISAQAKALNVTQDVLLEVNIGKEVAKHGFFAEDLQMVADDLQAIDNLRFMGLMCVLPRGERAENCAVEMKSLYDALCLTFKDFKYLSMGMSEDYPLALKHGANMLRLGRSIFGERK